MFVRPRQGKCCTTDGQVRPRGFWGPGADTAWGRPAAGVSCLERFFAADVRQRMESQGRPTGADWTAGLVTEARRRVIGGRIGHLNVEWQVVAVGRTRNQGLEQRACCFHSDHRGLGTAPVAGSQDRHCCESRIVMWTRIRPCN